MQRAVQKGFKIIKRAIQLTDIALSKLVTTFLFFVNGIEIPKKWTTMGIPVVNVNLKGFCRIGSNFAMHSGRKYNIIGRQQKCYFIVGPGAMLEIGNNVGISCTAIVCHRKIVIGNDVKIGGNVVIYDTDFHSLDARERNAIPESTANIRTAEVVIGDGVFIGAHSTILKGVSIGQNAIIGAGSIVTKTVPENELWAGNPAKFIKKIIE